jgi:type VI secretion system protein ImpK
MTERPKGDADPDATVMLPGEKGKRQAPDDDATVMMPSPKQDDDATVMIPAAKADEDATVMIPASRDDDATVVMPTPNAEAQADADATVMMPATAPAEPDPDATIAIPTPGRRRDAEAPVLPAAPAAGSEAAAIDPGTLGGINPLVAAANPILAIAAQVRHALKHPDPDGLRANLRRGIASFEQAARAAGAGDETIAAASLALSALVNESAASTPWGASWKSDETERFFDLLDRRAAAGEADRNLLEFFYACLALGFEGREGLRERRERLLEQLRALRPVRDGELSGSWRGVVAPARKPAGMLALWASASALALLLAALYAAYSVSLGSLSDPVARELAQLKAAPEPERPRAADAAAANPRIAEQLSAEIARGEVAVSDAAGTSTIVIRSDRLFASGSARLEASVEPVVLRVAEALDSVPGTVVVTGHTDDVPIRTARFPSNWELSTERAASVVKLMSSRLKDPGRLKAEGLADSAPAVPNDSAANRARNRRVEIILRSLP